MTTWKRLRALALRALHAWEWATIRAIDEWCETFLRAWRTGDGRSREVEAPRLPAALPVAPVAPVVDASPRRGEVGLRTPVREAPPARQSERSAERSAMDYATQPRMDERAIIAGLKRLGYAPEDARRAAAMALQSGETDASALMRRALASAQGK